MPRGADEDASLGFRDKQVPDMQQIEAQPSMKRPLDSLFSVEKEDGWTTITVRRAAGSRRQKSRRCRENAAGARGRLGSRPDAARVP